VDGDAYAGGGKGRCISPQSVGDGIKEDLSVGGVDLGWDAKQAPLLLLAPSPS
jgi:hypothetical protein